MLCRKPFITGGAAFGCGQCLPCRIKRRRIWVHRLLLESMLHAESSFVTVTYTDECCPVIGGKLSLRREDYRSWLKRLREKMARIVPGWKLRYFLVGEYGEESGRPHYHAALFGFRGCDYGDSRLGPSGDRKPCGCASCIIIQRSWGLGRVHQGVIERKSAQYLAGYTVKGMTNAEDDRLCGREPEFARMSLRPGIGFGAMSDVARVIDCYKLAASGDVQSALRHGSRILPLGRYLRERLRVLNGVTDEGKAASLEEWRKELSELRAAASALSDRKVFVEGTYSEKIFAGLLVEQDMQKVRQLEERLKRTERGKK